VHAATCGVWLSVPAHIQAEPYVMCYAAAGCEACPLCSNCCARVQSALLQQAHLCRFTQRFIQDMLCCYRVCTACTVSSYCCPSSVGAVDATAVNMSVSKSAVSISAPVPVQTAVHRDFYAAEGCAACTVTHNACSAVQVQSAHLCQLRQHLI
jgi:hypothetical protein